ncbi:MAG TPA: pyridoxal-dependent decarboxylase [Pyrinomonadaceae bacterium]|nr:pyridoxal-dependent decarboxylase [Pyrinomonadaceae bacterium]
MMELEYKTPAGESSRLMLDAEARAALWRRVVEAVEAYADDVHTLPVRPELEPGAVRAALASVDFHKETAPDAAIDFVVGLMRKYQTHNAHPRYFGLYDPATTTMGVAAEALAAAFNPQLAVWSQSPAAVEMEQHLVRAFGERFGYRAAQTEGTFTSGGAEANHTAVLTALTRAFPDFAAKGLRALDAQPVLYVSSEAHHSLLKAARMCGLGSEAVREIPVDGRFRMDAGALSRQIARDRSQWFAPFMVVATAGTTNAGAIDPVGAIADVAEGAGLWLHVDAAWGGAAALVPEMRHLLEGVGRADSITFDPHKWLSVPRGAGLYLTRRAGVLNRTFGVRPAYMPLKKTEGMGVVDPFSHSMQWSRRFIGLRVFLSLLVAGWDGYAAAVRHQVETARHLASELGRAGWEVVNDPSLAVVCFFDRARAEGGDADYLEALAEHVRASGAAWVSTTLVAGRSVLRACVTNYRTEKADVDALVSALVEARRALTV